MTEFRHNEECMGTVFQFFGRAENYPSEPLAEATRLLHEADELFSLYKPESPLSQLARGEVSISDLPDLVSYVWDQCQKWEERTDGWFSSMSDENTFDPSGYVKAWATVRAADKLRELGVIDFAINAGGDIYLSKDISPGFPKRIGIAKAESITNTVTPLTVLDLSNTEYFAVATSGNAERGEHIWNPKNYSYANHLQQVTVVAKDLITADVLATAIFASAEQAQNLIAKFAEDTEVLVIDAAGENFATPGFSALVAPV